MPVASAGSKLSTVGVKAPRLPVTAAGSTCALFHEEALVPSLRVYVRVYVQVYVRVYVRQK